MQIVFSLGDLRHFWRDRREIRLFNLTGSFSLEEFIQAWNTQRVVREHHSFTYIRLLICCLVTSACVSKPGNIRSMIDLPAPANAPSQVQSPEQPNRFPPVSLVWQRTQTAGPEMAWNLSTKKNKTPVVTDQTDPQELNNIELLLEAPRAQPAVGRNIGPFWLPPAPEDRHEKRFDREVTQALRVLVDKGRNNSRALLSLSRQLANNSDLSDLRKMWLPTLERAQSYAKATSLVREPLSLLKRAFRKARFDEYYGVFRDIDIPSCRWAAKRSVELLPTGFDGDFEVVIKGLGRHSLSSIATLCEQALVVELSEREFPKIKGRRNLRRMAQKYYERAHPEYKVYQASVPGAWKSDGNSFYLRAVMGVERDSDFPQTRCSIEEVEFSAPNKRSFQKPDCCEIVRSLPIDCEKLK